jgi:hypothetical protein
MKKPSSGSKRSCVRTQQRERSAAPITTTSRAPSSAATAARGWSSTSLRGTGANTPTSSASADAAGCPSRHLRVEQVEKAIERYYETIQFTERTASEIRTAVHAFGAALRNQHEAQTRRFERRIAHIQRKRDKLFEAFAADAMALEQFKRKQKQLDQDGADARHLQTIAVETYDNIEELAELALQVATNAAHKYRAADPLERRMMNQAIFKKLLVSEDGIEAAIYETPFADLLAEDFAKDLEHATADALAPETANPGQLSAGRGWNETTMARPRGFEPLTFGSVVGLNWSVEPGRATEKRN